MSNMDEGRWRCCCFAFCTDALVLLRREVQPTPRRNILPKGQGRRNLGLCRTQNLGLEHGTSTEPLRIPWHRGCGLWLA